MAQACIGQSFLLRQEDGKHKACMDFRVSSRIGNLVNRLGIHSVLDYLLNSVN